MKKTYSEKLQDPRWQKKRLEILNRDGFKCQMCSNDKKTLHVHHKEYVYGKQPWEYENSNFNTLCKDCHELIEFLHKKIVNKHHPLYLVTKKSHKGSKLFYIYAYEVETGNNKVHFVEEDKSKPEGLRYWCSLKEDTLPEIQKAFKKINSRTQVS